MLDARIRRKRLPSGEILLREVAVQAGAGDVVALLGASGTGKTATLRILLGLDRDFEGAVGNSARRVGAVFQEPRLLPWRTIGDNIRLVVPPGRPSPDIGGLLREVGLDDAEALYPRQASLGMARRAALARAMAITPDLLILDEPFASLDPGSAGRIAAYLSRAGDIPMVVAMHDVGRATAMATRIIVLSGRPATLAHQVEIAADATDADRAVIRTDLIRQFPFLADAPAPDL